MDTLCRTWWRTFSNLYVHDSYKERLLCSHTLVNLQKIEKLSQMNKLGDRKPSELLAQMWELCPRGKKSNEFFFFLFLEGLSEEFRFMLREDSDRHVRALAAKADKFMGQRSGSVCTIPADEEDLLLFRLSNPGGMPAKSRQQRAAQSDNSDKAENIGGKSYHCRKKKECSKARAGREGGRKETCFQSEQPVTYSW
jgi:hypothetical protein